MSRNILIMFDIDGTLLNTTSEDLLFSETMKEWLSIESIEDDWSTYKNITDSGIASELFLQVKSCHPNNDDINLACNIFYKKWSQKLIDEPGSCIPISGIHAFLQELHKHKDVSIAIATGGWEKTAKLKLNHSHILFSDIPLSTSNDSFSREQIMQIAYSRALEKTKALDFQKVIYFGDGSWDYKASRNLGYNFIAVNSSNCKDFFSGADVKYIIDDFTDYDHILDYIYE